MASVPSPVGEKSGEFGGQRHVVAVVDDDPGIRYALVTWLGYHGLCATDHASAESLLEQVRQENGQWLVAAHGAPAALPAVLMGAVVDVNLPGISGVDLARRLRASCPALPLVVVTALPADDLGRHGAMPEGVSCLRKPFDLGALEAAFLPASLGYSGKN